MTQWQQPDQEVGGRTYGGDYVAYEYSTVQVDRNRESLYRDMYRSCGWVVEGTTVAIRPNITTLTLKLKRDRRLRSRPLLNELQRKGENALATIQRLEDSQAGTAVAVSLGIGIVGAAFLAGSVFAIEAGLWLLSIPLGAVGLICWLIAYLAHGRVKAAKTASTAPHIDEQYELLYDAMDQASRLVG